MRRSTRFSDNTSRTLRKSTRPRVEVFEERVLMSTLSVLNVNDSGSDSLRQAILDSNASVGVADTINFDIPISGAHTIAPLSALPTITDPVTIDGTTQPGFSGTPIIELDGTNAGFANGLVILGGGCTVRGLVINRFQNSGFGGTGDGILIGGFQQRADVGGNRIEGNYIGLGTDGITPRDNKLGGIEVTNSSNNTIGGASPGAGNVIASNDYYSIVLGNFQDPFTPTGNVVQGNLIGTDATGTIRRANGGAVLIGNVAQTTIGGLSAEAGNVIAASPGAGIQIDLSASSSGLLIQHNFIGTDRTASIDLGNSYWGIYVEADGFEVHSGVTIGGTAAGAGNVIAFNGEDAVHVRYPTDVAVLSNSFFSNSSGLGYGNASGAGPNPHIAAPVLSAVALTPGGGSTVTGTFQGAPETTYRIEFFGGERYEQQGKTLLGAASVITDATGAVSFNSKVSGTLAADQGVFATATINDAETSAFSVQDVALPAVPVLPDLSLTGSPSPDSATVDGTLTYTFAVINNGQSTATGVTLTATLPSNVAFQSATATVGSVVQSDTGFTASFGTLLSGARASITIVVTATSAGPAAVTAGITSDQNDANISDNGATVTAAVTEPVAESADLSIADGNVPIHATIDQVVTYMLSASNFGPTSPATGVFVIDTIPEGATFVSATPAGYTQSGRDVMFDLGSLASGAPTVVTVSVRLGAGIMTNTARIGTNDQPDPISDDNEVHSTTEVGPAVSTGAELIVSGQVAVSSTNTLTYTFAIANTGHAPATSVALTAVLPGTTTFVSANQGGSVSGRVLSLPIGTVESGATAIAIVTLSSASGGPVELDVQVSSVETSAVGLHVDATVPPVVVVPTIPFTTHIATVTVTSLVRTGVHMQPTTLHVGFSGPMDRGSACDVRNYHVVAPGRDGKFGTHDDIRIALRAAKYDAATWSVAIRPERRLNFHHHFQITIAGAAPKGVLGLGGQFLDGGHGGHDVTIGLGPKRLQLATRAERMALCRVRSDGSVGSDVSVSSDGAH
jgi:uncharacterized repeat protein (TIGR01451 family)